MWTFVNLGVIVATLAVVIWLKMNLPFWNSVQALLSTIVIVAGSALLYSPAYGYGGWLMLTLPLSPVIFLSLWIAYAFGGLKSRPHFGRSHIDG